MKAAIREDTNPTIYSLPSMKNLLLFISTVPGTPPPGCRPGTAGSHLYKLAGMLSPVKWAFTLVKSQPAKVACRLVKECFSFMFSNRLAVEPAYGPVNISGIYRGNAWPTPAGSGARVFISDQHQAQHRWRYAQLGCQPGIGQFLLLHYPVKLGL